MPNQIVFLILKSRPLVNVKTASLGKILCFLQCLGKYLASVTS